MDDTTQSKLAANVAASPGWFSVQITAIFGVISTGFFTWLATIPLDQQIAFVTNALSKYGWGLPVATVAGMLLRYWARVHPQTPATPASEPGADDKNPPTPPAAQLGRITAPMLALVLASAFAVVSIAACSTTGTPMTAAQQQAKYTDDVGQATILVDQVTLAAKAAIDADVLHGQDADNTIAAIKVAKDGLTLVKQLVATNVLTSSQASARVAITLAVLTTTQTYLATMGKSKTPATGAKQ